MGIQIGEYKIIFLVQYVLADANAVARTLFTLALSSA